MRPFVFLLLLLASTAYAGSFEKCHQKEKDATGLRTCVDAERNHAANRLRDQNTDSLKAVEKIARDKRDPALVRQFRAQQAHHVRYRKNACRKQRSKNEQVACAADLDFAHIEKLKRYTKE